MIKYPMESMVQTFFGWFSPCFFPFGHWLLGRRLLPEALVDNLLKQFSIEISKTNFFDPLATHNLSFIPSSGRNPLPFCKVNCYMESNVSRYETNKFFGGLYLCWVMHWRRKLLELVPSEHPTES